MTRRGRDCATAPASKTSIADTVINIRRIFSLLMGCDSFRFARLSANYGRERTRRYFGCRGLNAGLLVLPPPGRKASSLRNERSLSE